MIDDSQNNEDDTNVVKLPDRIFDVLDEHHSFNIARMIEAMIFASPLPVALATLDAKFADEVDVLSVLRDLQEQYQKRGVNLVEVEGAWVFRTAIDLADQLQNYAVEPKKLTRAALETLAVIAYHQPVTRAEIEDIRGVSISRGILDVLLETEWVKLRGRRKTPGRPVTYGTTQVFLAHFGLTSVTDLPGLDELKGAGLLDPNMGSAFEVPRPGPDGVLSNEELPLDEEADEDA